VNTIGGTVKHTARLAHTRLLLVHAHAARGPEIDPVAGRPSRCSAPAPRLALGHDREDECQRSVDAAIAALVQRQVNVQAGVQIRALDGARAGAHAFHCGRSRSRDSNAPGVLYAYPCVQAYFINMLVLYIA